MKTFDFIDKLDTFHRYLLRENTGNADAFAHKLGISRASLYNIIDNLKDFDIQIKYSRNRATFYYEFPQNVKINVSIGVMDEENQRKVSGGAKYFDLSTDLDKLWINL